MSVLSETVALRDGHRIQTVRRDLVHRNSVAEVFVTGLTIDHDRVLVAAQWPRSNRFHLSPDGSHYDGLLVAETLRQAVIASSHLADAAAPDARFVMARTSLDLTPAALGVAAEPAQVTIELSRVPVARRRARIEARIGVDGVPAAAGVAEVVVLPAAAYARLRPACPPAPAPASVLRSHLEPGSVGRHFIEDVLVDEDPARSGSLVLRVDPRHPVHFDHPQDHVPGMLLLDAGRQAAVLRRPSARLTRVDAVFNRFVELDQLCRVAVMLVGDRDPSGAQVVSSTFVQGGLSRAQVRVVVEPW